MYKFNRVVGCLLGCWLWLFCGHLGATFIYTEDFNDNSLDPTLSVFTYPGFQVDIATQRANFSKDAGITGFGSARINTNFHVMGDFDVSVRLHRNNPTIIGLATYFSNGPFNEMDDFAAVYFIGGNSVALGTSNPSSFTTYSTTTSDAIFRLQRTGNTLSGYVDVGSGYNLIGSQTNVLHGRPAIVDLFLNEEGFSSGATSGWFDDLSITATVPEPSTCALALLSVPAFFALRRRPR